MLVRLLLGLVASLLMMRPRPTPYPGVLPGSTREPMPSEPPPSAPPGGYVNGGPDSPGGPVVEAPTDVVPSRSERLRAALMELRELLRGTGVTVTISDPTRAQRLITPGRFDEPAPAQRPRTI